MFDSSGPGPMQEGELLRERRRGNGAPPTHSTRHAMSVTPLRPCPVVMLSEPVPTMVEHDDDFRKGRLLLRQPGGAVLATSARIPRWGTPLCYVYPEQSTRPALVLEGVVLGTVARSLDLPEAEGYVLRWNWAYCAAGRAGVRDWLGELFAFPIDRPTDEDILDNLDIPIGDDREDGPAIFPFYRQSRSELLGVIRRLRGRPLPTIERGGSEGSAPDRQRVRADIRARVDHPCVFFCRDTGRHGQQARVYNVGRGGLFVATAGACVPDEKQRVTVRIQVEHRGSPTPIEIAGRVRWPSSRIEGSTLAGFGVSIESVADAARGQIFRAFLARCVENHLAGEPPSKEADAVEAATKRMAG